MNHPTNTYLIGRSSKNDRYTLWKLDPEASDLLQPVELDPEARFPSDHRLAQIGGYVLEWGPLCTDLKTPSFPYRLFELDPTSSDPLGADPLQAGFWTKKKFWGYRAHYSADPTEGQNLDLLPLGSFAMHFIGAEGRGTFELWNFDPNPNKRGQSDPLPEPYTGQGAFPTIQGGHELIPLGNYVLDRMPDGASYRLWSFDPQLRVPLSLPAAKEGRFDGIDAKHRLVPVGPWILDWVPGQSEYRLWRFDPHGDEPLSGPIRTGLLPSELDQHSSLFAVQPKVRAQTSVETVPGSIEHMRDKIEHVVYYMLESRSFDNVCGWLYEKGQDGIVTVGPDGPFDGASTDYYNVGVDGKPVHVSKFKDGKLSDQWELSAITQDPFHGNPDNLVQMFGVGERSYEKHSRPDMSGFVLNNASGEVMLTFSPEQLPIINGLARHFAVSDRWFSSIPGGTDVNRAFSVTGSAFDKLSTWEGGNAYKYFPKSPRRQSLWKVLWSYGITDWKIYNAILWEDAVFTYHLYLEGQVPSIDADPDAFMASVEQFKKDARAGNLPAFSFLEPVWIAPSGTTSYHPGGDLVVGEVALNEIYEALREGPAWDKTLLVVTFDKGGGIYDHASPPYAQKPWPNDACDGFHYDLMGPRVPTVLASPWIEEQTVLRARGPVAFDSTSFLATLLAWYGVPKARWCLGDRVEQAPTFEHVFTRESPRTDAPVLTPPYDKNYPASS